MSTSAQETSDLQRLSVAAQALYASAKEVFDGRLDLIRAQWRLSLSAAALALLTVVTAGALVAATWTLLSLSIAYLIWHWLAHWAWALVAIFILQAAAIYYLASQARKLLRQIAINLDPANGQQAKDTGEG